MSLLNFEPSGSMPKGEKKSLKIFLGIGLLAGTIALGSTLAASINLNDSGPVEFGQGVTQTTSCDSEVEVTPISSFVNSDGGGDFKFSAITLSDLDGTDQAESSVGCAGKTFTIKAYDSYGYQLQPTYEISVDANGNFSSQSGVTDGMEEGSENSSATITFSGGILTSAESIYRITVESENLVYEVGDMGPGGGMIFYYSELAFTQVGSECGSDCHYLEWAPSTWQGASDPSLSWSTDTVNSAGTSGAGFENTVAMLTPNGSYLGDTGGAAFAVNSYAGLDSTAGNWFLPSSWELYLIATSPVVSYGNFAGEYWSSSENVGGAWVMDIGTVESYGNVPKGWSYRVRPIRAF